MAYPFRPLTTEDLEKISKHIKNLILALKKSEQRFVISFPKDQMRIQNKTTVFD
jgi:hypothetical protein